MSHWPAMKKWIDVDYLLTVAGERTIPVEVGSHYADENWSQKLMTLKEFIRAYYLENTDTVGYLAQHNLFDQVSTFIFYGNLEIKLKLNYSRNFRLTNLYFAKFFAGLCTINTKSRQSHIQIVKYISM